MKEIEKMQCYKEIQGPSKSEAIMELIKDIDLYENQ